MPDTNAITSDAKAILSHAINAMLPGEAVIKALGSFELADPITLIAIGKAAWQMANAAHNVLGDRTTRGAVLTKYGHAQGAIGSLLILEGGHPISDTNGLSATQKILSLTANLTGKDTVLLLLSGGGSALFEAPAAGVTPDFLRKLNQQLIASGADINEINAVRKRFSAVKGGRFAQHCSPAAIRQIILSDIVGDNIENIASGPAAADSTYACSVQNIIKKYQIKIPLELMPLVNKETPKEIFNVRTAICGSVKGLCTEAAVKARKLGYNTGIITDSLGGDIEEAASLLANEAHRIAKIDGEPCAMIMGGEATVKLKGSGKGGRSQEFALISAKLINGLKDTVILAAGSDGTDGPTAAAGGIVDGETWDIITKKGLNPTALLENNSSYQALSAANALIITGPTGTNVNDIMIMLHKKAAENENHR